MDMRGIISAKAIQTIFDKLFEAKRENISEKEQIDNIIWPILKQWQKKMLQSARDEKVDLDKWDQE